MWPGQQFLLKLDCLRLSQLSSLKALRLDSWVQSLYVTGPLLTSVPHLVCFTHTTRACLASLWRTTIFRRELCTHQSVGVRFNTFSDWLSLFGGGKSQQSTHCSWGGTGVDTVLLVEVMCIGGGIVSQVIKSKSPVVMPTKMSKSNSNTI